MSSNPVHIYRAALRECTYLPDPNSRAFIKSWLTDSFRRYLPRDPKKPQCKPVTVTPERASKVLRRGRHLTHTLRRANEGYPQAFERVLQWTYARTGRRRREIMSTLSNQEPSASDLQEPGHEVPKKFSKDWEPPKTIIALLRSQSQYRRFFVWQDNRIWAQGPTIEATNIWGKPMPESRTKNKWKEWYAKHLELIYPPLPENEFNEIKALANGEKTLKPIARRQTASVFVYSEPDAEHRSVLTDPPLAEKVVGRPRQLTNRNIRRHFQRLLIHTPTTQVPKDRPGAPVVVKWDRADKGRWRIDEPNEAQASALFG
jgi:Complex 1 protein (LYR family)